MIELVFVISLLGSLYAIFLRPIDQKTVPNARLLSAANQIQSDLAALRSSALNSGNKQRAVITADSSKLKVCEEKQRDEYLGT